MLALFFYFLVVERSEFVLQCLVVAPRENYHI